MKIRSPIQLTDTDKAKLTKLTNWVPRIKVTIPAREVGAETRAARNEFWRRILKRNLESAKKAKTYPY